MNKWEELKTNLEQYGISRDCMKEGTLEGVPAIFLSKDENQDVYTGPIDLEPGSQIELARMEILYNKFS